MILSPSLLSADFSRLADELAALEAAGISWLHLDIMDGAFVPNITFGQPVIKSLRKRSSKLFFDVHLMIEEPARYLESFRDAGADMLVIHAEADRHPQRTLSEIRRLGMKAGLAFNPGTDIASLRWLAPDLDMVLVMSVNPGFSGQKFIPQSFDKIRATRAMLNAVVSATDDENATALAFRNYLGDALSPVEAETVVPFSSARKWSGARVGGVSYAVGAAEFVLGRDRGDIMSAANERAADGYRVLALVSSPLPFGEDNALPDDVTLEGFVYIADKIRKEAPDTLKFFRDHGVAVKIISGDNPATVSAVARRAGLADYNNWVDMSTLKTEDEVREAALVYTVFGRVLPDQKLLLVKALKAAGHTVAMTGDGVNDVLALKESDCSVAMASGSDAAKNVSSIVLLDSNFASMPRVVAEGRRSINNLERSASLYLAKTIYNVLIALIFMAVPAGLPFEPKQLTLIGGITIGLPSCVIALEPNTELVKGRSLTKMLCKAVPGGIAVALAVAAATVAQQYFLHLNAAQLDNLYVLVTTITGLIFLFRVCLPFNLLHGITYVVMIGLFAAVFLADIPFFNSFFGISRDITAEMGKAIAAIIAVIAVIYVTVSILTRNLDKTIDLKLNEKMNKKVSV